jgi:hypothetical protein
MRKLEISTGTRFGRLSIVKEVTPYVWNNIKYRQFECKCDCNKIVEVRLDRMKSGAINSCGCYHKDKVTKHNHSNRIKKSPEYQSYSAMIQRCTNPKNRDYKNYGGRGITVCKEWLASFEQFYKDMGSRPIGTTLDRIDSDWNYEPNKCRWSTPKVQANNRRKTKMI